MNYSSSSHISPSGISSDLYPQDLQSLHIHSSPGLECLTLHCLVQSGLCRVKTIGFSFNQISSITINQTSGLSSHSLFPPRSAEIKVKIRKRNKTVSFPIQTTNIFFTMNFNTEIDFFRSGSSSSSSTVLTEGDKPPRQEQTYISY